MQEDGSLPLKRIVYVTIASVLLSVPGYCQTGPAWPDIRLSGCPKISPPKSQRAWKYGEAEQTDFQAIAKVPDRKQAAELLVGFANKYPDSDYRDLALFAAMGIGLSLKDFDIQVRAAKIIVESPSGEPAALVGSFVIIDDGLARFVRPDDPEKTRKFADLDLWTRCGKEALAAQTRPEGVRTDAYQKARQTSETVLFRTAGDVAMNRGDYVTARLELEKAATANPNDTLTFLLLGWTNVSSENVDMNAAVFYLARASELSPQISQLADLVRQSYTTLHGSEKGFDKLLEIARSNTAPPSGFNILPKPKKERHYGTAVAASAIMALLVYGAVKHPDFMIALGQSLGGQSRSNGTGGQNKLMILAGSNHETYLGCLNCVETGSDSISNEYGQNGSRYSRTSIWNHYSQFGSPYAPYSACNPYSTDPPVIVDDGGTYYGRLTVNEFHPELAAGRQLISWLKQVVCAE
jgi:hypothetical protein